MRSRRVGCDTDVNMTGGKATFVFAIATFERHIDCGVDMFSFLDCDLLNVWIFGRLLEICHFPARNKVLEAVQSSVVLLSCDKGLSIPIAAEEAINIRQEALS